MWKLLYELIGFATHKNEYLFDEQKPGKLSIQFLLSFVILFER